MHRLGSMGTTSAAPRLAHTVTQVRDAEAELIRLVPEGTLMARAATALATAVADFLGRVYGARLLLVVGTGDNGGDALFAGALLARRGASVEAICLGRPHEQGRLALLAAGGRLTDPDDTDDPADTASRDVPPDVLVDGIVGIGGRPGLRPEAEAVIARFAGVPVVAVDVPSGVSVDDGRLDGPHVTAELTVAFGTLKVCHLVDPAAAAAGEVVLADLGLDLPPAAVSSLGTEQVAALLPVPPAAAQKYTRGVLGVRAGSADYPGAGLLCVAGADCGLAGMVRYAPVDDDEATALAVRTAHPEVVATGGRVQAWVVGSGGGERAGEALEAVLAEEAGPVLVDADALAHLDPADPRSRGGRLLLTPHAGELAALLGVSRAQIEASGLEWVRRAAADYDAVVVLKGRRTLIARPDGAVRVNTTGIPWLATAGAGDVLAGLVGALLAAGLEPFDAASLGCWLHGTSATLAGGPLIAGRLAAQIPAAVRAVAGAGPRA